MKIITVLRTGGDFRPCHVEALRDQCRSYAPRAEFICLSDVEGVPGYKPLRHDWPGWWAKMEVFTIKGPCLYIDLDTVLLGDVTPFLAAAALHDFIALRDFNPQQREMGSGLMAWRGDLSRLYADFAEDPERAMAECRTAKAWGDQGFIEPRTAGRAYWQQILPGLVASYKKDCRDGRAPRTCRILCFHGNPRPWQAQGFRNAY